MQNLTQEEMKDKGEIKKDPTVCEYSVMKVKDAITVLLFQNSVDGVRSQRMRIEALNELAKQLKILGIL